MLLHESFSRKIRYCCELRILTRSVSNQLTGFTHVVPIERHYDMIAAIYKARGFNDQESKDAAFVATQASK